MGQPVPRPNRACLPDRWKPVLGLAGHSQVTGEPLRLALVAKLPRRS